LGFEKLFAAAGKNDARFICVPGAGDSLEYRQEHALLRSGPVSVWLPASRMFRRSSAEMRLRKSPLEIALMQHAIDITTEAHERAWIAQATQNGV